MTDKTHALLPCPFCGGSDLQHISGDTVFCKTCKAEGPASDKYNWDHRAPARDRDRLHLQYLADAPKPLWGGHLERGEPIPDPDMQRWLALEWIEQVNNEGYQITNAGRAQLKKNR